MKEEIKNNALNDEELNKVAGGDGIDLGVIHWCPKCQQNRRFRMFMAKEPPYYRTVCPIFLGTDYEDPHPCQHAYLMPPKNASPARP